MAPRVALRERRLATALSRGIFALGLSMFVASFALGALESVRATGRPPELPFDQLGQARELAAAGDHEAAARQLRTYALINSQQADGWTRLGAYLWRALGDRAGAIEAYERSLTTLPTPAEAHLALAILYASDGRLSEADEQARIATSAGLQVPAGVWEAIARRAAP